MAKHTNKKKKGVIDPYAFKGTERLDVVFTTNLPDYKGTEMQITPKFKVLPDQLLLDGQFTLDSIDDEFLESIHDQKVADFLTEQFLDNKNNK